MTLPKLSIKDSLFSHAYSSSNWFKPSYFEWDFKNVNGDVLVFTDRNLPDVVNYNGVKKIAWMVESPVVTPREYEYIYNNHGLFDTILTHRKILLDKPNAKLLPIGGCHLDENEISLEYEKSRLVSMMFSAKRFAKGQEIRFAIATKFKELVDIMGSGLYGQHVKKIHSCKDYAFSIAIENCKEDYYFTEKIIDCFLSGTVPIYWGCPSIGDFFNMKGIIPFDEMEELAYILEDRDGLTNFYINNAEHIIDNFNRALKYKICEDFMYLNYNSLLFPNQQSPSEI